MLIKNLFLRRFQVYLFCYIKTVEEILINASSVAKRVARSLCIREVLGSNPRSDVGFFHKFSHIKTLICTNKTKDG